MSKIKTGIFGLTTCKGDQVVIHNCKDQLQDIVELVSFPPTNTETNIAKMNIALVEGQVSNQKDLELLNRIRENAKYLVALGTCACDGGIQAAIKEYGIERNKEKSHLDVEAKSVSLDDPGSLENFVEVDYYIRGCPARGENILYFMNKFANEGVNKNDQLRFPVLKPSKELDLESIIELDQDKCILCRRCDNVCNKVLGIQAIGASNRGAEAKISTPFGVALDETSCIYCGQCIATCPVGAFDVRSSVETASRILEDNTKPVVAVIDPVSLSSVVESSLIAESDVGVISKKIISALKDNGVDKVFNFLPYKFFSSVAQAESVNEKDEPVFTSWCPSARSYLENLYPRYEKYLQEKTSPEALLLKHIENHYDKEKLEILFVTPCISQKRSDRFDAVLTSREITRLLSSKDIWLDMRSPKGVAFDNDLGIGEKRFIDNGFVFTPLIMKIAYQLRFGNMKSSLTTSSPEEGVYEYTLQGDEPLNGLVVKRLSKSKTYLKKDISQHDVAELIPCPGGCITGGGQYPTTSKKVVEDREKSFRTFGEATSESELILELIDAYSQLKEEI